MVDPSTVLWCISAQISFVFLVVLYMMSYGGRYTVHMTLYYLDYLMHGGSGYRGMVYFSMRFVIYSIILNRIAVCKLFLIHASVDGFL